MIADAKDLDINDFIYNLPDERIARHPLAVRDACKLLVADSNGVKSDHIFRDLPALLPEGAMLVYNNTRVINARIRMHKPSGAAIEIFCLEPVSPADYERNFASRDGVTWRCFVGNSKRWKSGELSATIDMGDETVTLSATRRPDGNDGRSWLVDFHWDNPAYTFADVIGRAGVIPIPPYLNRDTEASDFRDYQTVFSRIDGSVAAPTAGLHFTDNLLKAVDAAGIRRRHVTLHVGAGTFQPVKSECIGDHRMHSELIVVDKDFIRELAENSAPVYAVGTTSVRTLESLYHIGCMISQKQFSGELPQWYWQSPDHPRLSVKDSMDAIAAWLDERNEDHLVASTRIIIAPTYRYMIVDGLVTNFHQPGSTLLLLVSALIGDRWHEVYEHALKNGYRFLSYGDACLFTR